MFLQCSSDARKMAKTTLSIFSQLRYKLNNFCYVKWYHLMSDCQGDISNILKIFKFQVDQKYSDFPIFLGDFLTFSTTNNKQY